VVGVVALKQLRHNNTDTCSHINAIIFSVFSAFFSVFSSFFSVDSSFFYRFSAFFSVLPACPEPVWANDRGNRHKWGSTVALSA
jgi:hypothetical protein